MAKPKAAKDETPLRIIKLIGRNFKGLVAVEINLEGDVIQFCGPNGAGKSSVMDIIPALFGGKGEVPDMPIRQGETEAFLQADLGDGQVTKLRATKTFKLREDGKSVIERFRVENADGFRPSDPQTYINGLLGKHAFDPFEWDRLKMPAKVESLKAFVPGVDFSAIAEADKKDRDDRRDINRDRDALKAQIDAIVIPEDAPTEKVDEKTLVDEIASVGDHNATIERRKENRSQAATEAASHRREAATKRDRAADLRAQADSWDREADEHETKAGSIEKRLAEAESLPELKDAAEVRARLEAAQAANALVDMRTKRDALTKQHDDLDAKSTALTEAIRTREADKVAAVAAAALPVKGLGFDKNRKGEDIVTLNGIPLDQVHTAERIRASIAIAMAEKPRLRTLRINEGSLLDKASMKILAEMCHGQNYQALVEVVSDEPKAGFFIEEGRIREPVAAEKAAD